MLFSSLETSPQPAPDHAADIAACRAMLRAGSKSFFAASLLLPKRVRDPASALYAFCRLADDAVDLSADPQAALAHLRLRLDRAYASSPLAHPVDRAFAHVVARYAIPRAVPDALFEGFEWDCDGRSYETIADLEAYAVRVAGTVGVMMTLLMGVRGAETLARAADLGVAMQLTNIARDVGEDARAGRIYLPTDWLVEAGIDRATFLRSAQHTPALASVVARLLAVANAHYARAEAGIAALPRDCRPAIRAASRIYARIGRRIAENGHDAVTSRAIIGKAAKLALIGKSFVPRARSATDLAAPPILAARELILASAENPAMPVARRPVRRAGLSDRFIGVVDLFERLERRAHERRIGA